MLICELSISLNGLCSEASARAPLMILHLLLALYQIQFWLQCSPVWYNSVKFGYNLGCIAQSLQPSSAVWGSRAIEEGACIALRSCPWVWCKNLMGEVCTEKWGAPKNMNVKISLWALTKTPETDRQTVTEVTDRYRQSQTVIDSHRQSQTDRHWKNQKYSITMGWVKIEKVALDQ